MSVLKTFGKNTYGKKILYIGPTYRRLQIFYIFFTTEKLLY